MAIILKIFGVGVLLYAGYVIIKLIIHEYKSKESQMDNITLYSMTVLLVVGTMAMIYYIVTTEISMELIKSSIR